MASATLADIVAKVQALVNDSVYYTQAVLLPDINIAQDELADELRNNGVGQTKFINPVATITAGTTGWMQTTSPALPLNLVEPLVLYERAVGASEQDFIPMIGPGTIPNTSTSTALLYWDWIMSATNGPTIQFNPAGGATVDREVRLIYLGDLTPFAASGDKSMFYGAQNALSYKTASLVSASRGGTEGVQDYDTAWTRAKTRYIEEMVKVNQGVTGRRRPWLGAGRYLVGRF
jgi:hypothetical protein